MPPLPIGEVMEGVGYDMAWPLGVLNFKTGLGLLPLLFLKSVFSVWCCIQESFVCCVLECPAERFGLCDLFLVQILQVVFFLLGSARAQVSASLCYHLTVFLTRPSPVWA